jgi:hypothetical protein
MVADAVLYCRQAEEALNAPTLFDLLAAEEDEPELPTEETSALVDAE